MNADAITATSAYRLGAWGRHGLALGAVAGAILALFARDAGDVAAIWWGSSSYEHCLLIVPVIGWLAWLRRGSLAAVRPAGWLLPLGWVGAGAAGWLVGEAAGVGIARHLGLLMMLHGAVAALLGPSAMRILLFPLGYALFLVPAGDALVPPLQTLTARMCMAWLHLVRVPATLDGVFITTPGGWFKVAEACSGAKFLIAMTALGVLVAHLGFATWRRRLPFVALCLVVPVLANGLRAFATIWVAQRRGAQAADGFDHVVYGWFFFAAVIALVLACGWRFFDRAPDKVPAPREIGGRALPLGVAAAATLAIAGAAPLWARAADAREAAIAANARLPDVAGWRPAPPAVPWRPRFDGADRLLVRRYRDDAGRVVDLAVALYARQGEGRVLVGYGHGAADPDGAWAWTADAAAPSGWRGERIEGPGGVAREAATAFVVGGASTPSPARVKLRTLAVRLGGGGPLAGAVIVSAEDRAGGAPAVAAFVAALGAPVPLVDRVASGR
ncbi:exosortase A [Sphingomonas sp.]|uniref:exosortase A n=1 Tax=Sphingomonas sp. TaxID=28214 RepID=UPI003B0099D4